MNDAELVRKLHETADALTRILALMETSDSKDGHTLLSRMKESYNGWPASTGYDRGSARVTDDQGDPLPLHSDPTGETAIREDRARDDRLSIDRDVNALERSVRHLLDTASRHILRDANLIERQATTGKDDPGCSSCARIPGPRTKQWWNPRFRGDLCRWCLDYQRAMGRLPTTQELIDYRDGKRVRRTA